eukprot:s1984_g2.t3
MNLVAWTRCGSDGGAQEGAPISAVPLPGGQVICVGSDADTPPRLLQELAAASQPCQAYVADEEGLLVLALFADASFALIRPHEARSHRGTAELLSALRRQKNPRPPGRIQKAVCSSKNPARLWYSNKMLQIRMISGEMVVGISEGELEELVNARGVKQRLSQLHGFPPRFRQRLLHHGENLEDIALLHSPMDLDLVLLPFADLPESCMDELCNAASEGWLAKVERLLQLPQDPDFCRWSLTPLRLASCNGHVEIVRLLLEAGADKDLADNDGYTPLISASSRGHVEIARLLLEAGANKDMATSDGATALMFASGRGDVEVARLLLQAGADPDLGDDDGDTPLMIASSDGHVDIARLLLEAGANTDMTNNEGIVPLMAATKKRDVEVARLLLEANADKDLADHNGKTPLIFVSWDGHVEMARLLLEANADKNLADHEGNTPLTLASLDGHVEMARLLLEAGADKDLADYDGYTPFFWASSRGHVELARLLLEADANKHVADSDGATALMFASEMEVARLNLETGADRDLADQEGHTPLIWASSGEQVSREQLRASLEALPCSLQLSLIFGGRAQGEHPPSCLSISYEFSRCLTKAMAAPLVPKPKQQGMFDYGTLASVEKCTSEELAEKWLGKLDLKDASHVKQAFQEHGVIGTDVVYLDLSDLQVLCDKVGDRKKILRSLHELKNAKVMQEKNRIIGKFYPWEPWGCCCLCRNRDVPVIVLPTVIKFKTRPSLKFPSVESCISRERITESVLDQDSVLARHFGVRLLGLPFLVVVGRSSHLSLFVLGFGEAEV